MLQTWQIQCLCTIANTNSNCCLKSVTTVSVLSPLGWQHPKHWQSVTLLHVELIPQCKWRNTFTNVSSNTLCSALWTIVLNTNKTVRAVTDLQICRQSHVDLLSIRSDSVEEEGVMQGAVPHCLEAVESPDGNTLTNKQTGISTIREKLIDLI